MPPLLHSQSSIRTGADVPTGKLTFSLDSSEIIISPLIKMTTLPYTFTQSDLEFHSEIMKEHCIFLHLGLEKDPLKDQAYTHYLKWNDFISNGYNGDVLSLLGELKLFKTEILERLLDKEWLGWLSASFMTHILEELLQFELLLSGQKPTPDIEASQALTLMTDHLNDAESKLDPHEKSFKAVAWSLQDSIPVLVEDRDLNNVLQQYQEAVKQVTRENGVPANDVQWMIGLTLRAGKEIDKFFGKIRDEKPVSIINEALLSHWLREHHHMEAGLGMTLEELRRR